MKKLLAAGLAIITFIALPVSAALADDKEPSGSREDTQFAYRETGILLAQATTLSRTTVITNTTGMSGSGTGSKITAGGTAGSGAGGISTGSTGNSVSTDVGATGNASDTIPLCSGCIIGTHCFTEISNHHICCTAYRSRENVLLSNIQNCIAGIPSDTGVEYVTWPRVCGDRLIDNLPGGTEQCDPPGVQGVCASGQSCNHICRCQTQISLPPSGGIPPTIVATPSAHCGDGAVNYGEECDPSVPFNPLIRSGCSAGQICAEDCRCVVPPIIFVPLSSCGNGRIDAGEQCEAGMERGSSSGLGCSAGQVCENCLCVNGTRPPPARQCTSAFGRHPMDEANSVCCRSGCKAWKTCQERFCPATGAADPFTAADCRLYAKAIETATEAGTDPDCPAGPPPPPGGTCIPDGIREPLLGEQCDTFELSESAARAQLVEFCPPPTAGQQIDVCDMRDCSCSYDQISCAGRTIDGATVQCNGDTDCASDSVCDSNCQCRTITPPPPPPPPEPPVAERRPDCSVEVISFSSDAAKEKLDQLNKKEIAEITGRTDLDVYVEREQMARVVCVTKMASQTAGKGNTIGYGVVPDSTVMSSWDSIASRPMQLIQTGGSVFIDFNNTDQMQFKRVELVEQPVRILPLEGQAGISLSEAVPIGTLLPNITSSVSSTGDAANVNNMIDYQGFNLGAGQTYSFNASGSVDILSADGVLPVSTADRIDVFNFRMPIGCATWAGVEGYAGCKPIEDQEHDPAAVKNFIRSQVIPGEAVKSSVVYGAPWEKIDNFTFILNRGAGAPSTTDPGAMAASPAAYSQYDPAIGGIATEHKFAVLAADPVWLGEGGGGCKGCYVNGTGASAGEAMPALIAFITMLGGIVVRRVRRK